MASSSTSWEDELADSKLNKEGCSLSVFLISCKRGSKALDVRKIISRGPTSDYGPGIITRQTI